jgi:hypothetical protein
LLVGDHPLVGRPESVVERDGFRLLRTAAR